VNNTSLEILKTGVEDVPWLVEALITTLLGGFISYILKRFDAATKRKEHIFKDYRGSYQSISFMLYLQLMFLIFVLFLVLARYVFCVLAELLGLYKDFAGVIFVVIAFLLIGE